MFEVKLKSGAVEDVGKIALAQRKRILEKLKFFALQDNPLSFAVKLKNTRFGEYRFRVGDYRVIFDVRGRDIIVLKIGHRKSIYK